LKPES
jgi:hypothetical protein